MASIWAWYIKFGTFLILSNPLWQRRWQFSCHSIYSVCLSHPHPYLVGKRQRPSVLYEGWEILQGHCFNWGVGHQMLSLGSRKSAIRLGIYYKVVLFRLIMIYLCLRMILSCYYWRTKFMLLFNWFFVDQFIHIYLLQMLTGRWELYEQWCPCTALWGRWKLSCCSSLPSSMGSTPPGDCSNIISMRCRDFHHYFLFFWS